MMLRAKKAFEITSPNVERLTKYRDAAAIRLKVGEVTKTTLLRAEAELSGAQSEEDKGKERASGCEGCSCKDCRNRWKL